MAPSAGDAPVQLGLIGDNIGDSRSPELHRLAGLLCGLEVRYDLLVPAALGLSFDAVFEQARRDGRRGVNVTYPYKEAVVSRLVASSPDVARVGSANTVVFAAEGPVGYNTDYLGFISAYRAGFGDRAAGKVAIVGAGGVGRAIAFALVDLGATELRLADADAERAGRLALALRDAVPQLEVRTGGTAAEIVPGAGGVVNCTPLGMTGRPGTAVPADLLGGQAWAFDAVYTPSDTPFLLAARRLGIATLSGYELFFHQGIRAFELFTGRMPPLGILREQLLNPLQHREVS